MSKKKKKKLQSFFSFFFFLLFQINDVQILVGELYIDWYIENHLNKQNLQPNKAYIGSYMENHLNKETYNQTKKRRQKRTKVSLAWVFDNFILVAFSIESSQP